MENSYPIMLKHWLYLEILVLEEWVQQLALSIMDTWLENAKCHKQLKNFMTVQYIFYLGKDIRFTDYICTTRTKQNNKWYDKILARLMPNLIFFQVTIHTILKR